jgi:hypothetical protein
MNHQKHVYYVMFKRFHVFCPMHFFNTRIQTKAGSIDQGKQHTNL